MTALRCCHPHSPVTGWLPWVGSFGNSGIKISQGLYLYHRVKVERVSKAALHVSLSLGVLKEISSLYNAGCRRTLALYNYASCDSNKATGGFPQALPVVLICQESLNTSKTFLSFGLFPMVVISRARTSMVLLVERHWTETSLMWWSGVNSNTSAQKPGLSGVNPTVIKAEFPGTSFLNSCSELVTSKSSLQIELQSIRIWLYI